MVSAIDVNPRMSEKRIVTRFSSPTKIEVALQEFLGRLFGDVAAEHVLLRGRGLCSPLVHPVEGAAEAARTRRAPSAVSSG